jgi:predicted acyltransferase
MAVLGRFRDSAHVVDGQVVVSEWYTYTWILSSLNFIVTVLSGVLAGEALKSTMQQDRKVLLLLIAGIAMVALGWTWDIVHPVIKHIWTGSMVLVSSGYCFLLMALFYWWIDCRGHNSGLTFLKVYGMNSITAYVVSHVVRFSSISRSLFFGLEQYVGDYYGFIIQLSNVAILFVILYIMYRNKIFLRV